MREIFLRFVLCFFMIPGVLAIELPDNFVDESFVSGIDGQVTGFDWGPAGRLFIVEKAGVVRVVQNGSLLPQSFLDINKIVNDRVDRGLLSVAVHPDFPNKPYIYILFTYDPPELISNGFTGAGALDGSGNRVARLVRYTADAGKNYNVAIAGSEKTILGKNSTYENIGDPNGRYDTDIPSCGAISNPVQDCMPIDELSHTIGAVRFGPDGSLYVSNGDGASYHSFEPMTVMVQDLDSMRGKVFRINPETGEGYADNPYYDGDTKSNRSKVINSGLRNPYSMTIHPLTEEPFVGDVGLDLWEEIDGGYAKNFAWPCYSGAEGENLRRPGFEEMAYCQEFYASNIALQAPVISWPRNDTGSAIVGDFYFSDNFPIQFHGKLFYADFLQGWMRYADVDDPDNIVKYDFATDMLPVVEIRMGPDGALYYASITTREIRRIRYTGDINGQENIKPIAKITSSIIAGYAPLTVSFSAAESSDLDGEVLAYAWDFGNGETSELSAQQVTYQSAGVYEVSLEVTDNQGASDFSSVSIEVRQGQSPILTLSAQGPATAYAVGENVLFSGSATLLGAELATTKLRWVARIYAGDEIRQEVEGSVGRTFSFLYPDHKDAETVSVCLIARGNDDLEKERCEKLNAKTTDLLINAYPTGFKLNYAGIPVYTPFTVTALQGSKRVISAPEQAGVATFLKWSDAGKPTHTVIISDESTSFVASYDVQGVTSAYKQAFSSSTIASCREGIEARLVKANNIKCWEFFWNPIAALEQSNLYEALKFIDGRYQPSMNGGSLYLGRDNAHTGNGTDDGAEISRFAIAAYNVIAGGKYSIVNSSVIDKNDSCGDGMDLRILLNGQAVKVLDLPNGESADFNHTLGELDFGDIVHIAAGPKASTECDSFSWDFALQQETSGESPPRFRKKPDAITMTVGGKVEKDFSAFDLNGDALTYSATNLPDGLFINAGTGIVTGELKQSGLYNSQIKVSDGIAFDKFELEWQVKNADGTIDTDSSGGSGTMLMLSLIFVLIRIGRNFYSRRCLYLFNRKSALSNK